MGGRWRQDRYEWHVVSAGMQGKESEREVGKKCRREEEQSKAGKDNVKAGQKGRDKV